jgi:hypothetical protein
MRRHRYVTPQFLLVRDMRRENLDVGDGGTEAVGCKQWGVSGVHTLWVLLYRCRGHDGRVGEVQIRPWQIQCTGSGEEVKQ